MRTLSLMSDKKKYGDAVDIAGGGTLDTDRKTKTNTLSIGHPLSAIEIDQTLAGPSLPNEGECHSERRAV